jgi:hypothetical protein
MRLLTAIAVIVIPFALFAQAPSKEEKRAEHERIKQQIKAQKEDERVRKEKQKEAIRAAALTVPSVQISAPAERVRALVIQRINASLGFNLSGGDGKYLLVFSRQPQYNDFGTTMRFKSVGSNVAETEQLSLTFVEVDGKTSISSDREFHAEFIARRVNKANDVGKWNLELQRFLDDVKYQLEVLEAPKAAAKN